MISMLMEYEGWGQFGANRLKQEGWGGGGEIGWLIGLNALKPLLGHFSV